MRRESTGFFQICQYLQSHRGMRFSPPQTWCSGGWGKGGEIRMYRYLVLMYVILRCHRYRANFTLRVPTHKSLLPPSSSRSSPGRVTLCTCISDDSGQ